MLAQIAQRFGVSAASFLEEQPAETAIALSTALIPEAQEEAAPAVLPEAPQKAADEPENPVPQELAAEPESAASQEDERGAAPVRHRRLRAAAVLAALLILAAVICAGAFGRKPSRFTMEQFTRAQQPQAGQAFLELSVRETPVQPVRGRPDSDAFFKFPVFIRETNGVGMTIERLTYVTFYQSGKTEAETLTGDILREGVGATFIGPGEIRVLNNTSPAQPKKRAVGLLIEGTDERGAPLSFHLLVPYAYGEN